VRAEIDLEGEDLLTLRRTDARDTAEFVRSGRIKLSGDEVHALETLAFLVQGDLFFGPKAAFNARPGIQASSFSVFAATRSALRSRLPGWLMRLREPRAFTVRHPFSGHDDTQLCVWPDLPAARYVPFEPPFPFVELPIDYHYPEELVLLYGCIMRFSEAELPNDLEEAQSHYERQFVAVLSNGSDPSDECHVEVLSLDRTFRDRLAAMSADEWSTVLSRLGLKAPGMTEAFRALYAPLHGLAATATHRDEDLWLFGRS
jgi:hypothetical protein